MQGGTIFGSLGTGGAEMFCVVRDLGAGRRGAFVVKSMAAGGKELAMKRYAEGIRATFDHLETLANLRGCVRARS